jgi:PPOX class probable F420-dependent enzyme
MQHEAASPTGDAVILCRPKRNHDEETSMTDSKTGVIPESHYSLLDSTSLASVATTGPNGEPQVTPVWFDWDGEHILFSQTMTRQKVRNLEKDPRVALSLVDPENPYRYLEIRGRMVEVRPDPDLAFINKMAKKYLGKDVYPWHRPGDERVVVVIQPEHTTQMG